MQFAFLFQIVNSLHHDSEDAVKPELMLNNYNRVHEADGVSSVITFAYIRDIGLKELDAKTGVDISDITNVVAD